jgi:hypothetical protein
LLDSLITSKTRIRLLLKFFLNPGTRAYLREISSEFGESSNAIRIELNRLSKAKLLKSEQVGRTIQYQAETQHPLFRDIENIVRKYVGLDKLILNLFKELGGVDRAFITGDYAKGIDSGLIDLVIVGNIEANVLRRLTVRTETLINRKIRTLVLTISEYNQLQRRFEEDAALLLWAEGEDQNDT